MTEVEEKKKKTEMYVKKASLYSRQNPMPISQTAGVVPVTCAMMQNSMSASPFMCVGGKQIKLCELVATVVEKKILGSWLYLEVTDKTILDTSTVSVQYYSHFVGHADTIAVDKIVHIVGEARFPFEAPKWIINAQSLRPYDLPQIERFHVAFARRAEEYYRRGVPFMIERNEISGLDNLRQYRRICRNDVKRGDMLATKKVLTETLKALKFAAHSHYDIDGYTAQQVTTIFNDRKKGKKGSLVDISDYLDILVESGLIWGTVVPDETSKKVKYMVASDAVNSDIV